PKTTDPTRSCQLSAFQKALDAGGRATFTLRSPCGAIGDVTIRYAGYQFRQRATSNTGEIDMAFDLLAGPGRLTFEAAGLEPASVEAQGGRMQELVKYILVWSGTADLDLHVLQWGARIGDPDHVWVGRPRSIIEAQSGATGFISSADDGLLPGDHAEVFTFIKSLNHRRGGMQLRVDYKSRGDAASGEFCGTGLKARTDYKLLRYENGRLETVKSGFFRALECGTRLTPDSRYAPIDLIRF
ncbi:MAG: hypothetical protein K2Y05_08340, partial [Hyphomicrobiaceae bacterium]|nr:hypothetical protein [Hyphomicrobiaceae bacterium]